MSERDPNQPVLIGTAQLNFREAGSEPVEMMADAAAAAVADAGGDEVREAVESIRVVKGIWPYKDPGRAVAERLGLGAGVHTAVTQIGGNEVYDLTARTAAEIQAGELGIAVICAAEHLRTRRADRAAGRDSNFHVEPEDAAPDSTYGVDKELNSSDEAAAGLRSAVNFYATAESAIRHRNGESPQAHMARVSEIAARGSVAAAANPSAWLRDEKTAEEVATISDRNRLVAAPYPKLMTSNINVDQAAAVVMCSAAVADRLGVPADARVYPLAASGANDSWSMTHRLELDGSPAMRESVQAALDLAGLDVGDMDLLDLYSCFPAAVQVAQRELGIDPSKQWTITGGLTFAGGPLNSYCLHALARGIEMLRDPAHTTALLTGNGGYFTKHSCVVLSSDAPTAPFASARPQETVDAFGVRPDGTGAGAGTIEAYTVEYSHDGRPQRAIVAVLDEAGGRTWTNSTDADLIDELLAADQVGRAAQMSSGDGEIPVVTFADRVDRR